VAVPDDPALVSPVSIVGAEHASWTVFVLPAVLFVVLVLVGSTVLLVRRRQVPERAKETPGGAAAA
jgi:hypothetical protein